MGVSPQVHSKSSRYYEDRELGLGTALNGAYRKSVVATSQNDPWKTGSPMKNQQLSTCGNGSIKMTTIKEVVRGDKGHLQLARATRSVGLSWPRVMPSVPSVTGPVAERPMD